ncbi:MAG: hypothetical protein AAF480_04585 [Actinomycetota bacterium]
MAWHRRTWLVAVVGAVALVVPPAGAQELGTATQLTDDFDEPDLYDWEVSPDGEWVVALLEDMPDENPPGLYAIPTGGGAAIELAPAPVAQFRISADSSVVAFAVELPSDEFEIATVPITGGTPTVAATTSDRTEIHALQISGDGGLAFFPVANPTLTKEALFAVRTDGGAEPVQISRTGRDVERFQLVESQQRVVYETARCTIYSVPFGGGPSVRLSKGQSVARCDATPTPDGSRVVFTARKSRDDDKVRVFSTPTTGGTPRRLNSAIVDGGHVLQFGISADSSRVVYRADAEAAGRHELFSVPIDRSSRAVKLHPDPPRWADVRSNFAISPDSTMVVYRQDGETNGDAELYAVPIAGGTRTKLSPSPVEKGDARQLLVTADSTTVVYRGDMLVDRQYELFAVGLDGTNHRRLNPPLRRTGDVRPEFTANADGSSVTYRADWSSSGDDHFVVDVGTDVARRVSGDGLGIDLNGVAVLGTASFAFSGSIHGQDGSHLFLVAPAT